MPQERGGPIARRSEPRPTYTIDGEGNVRVLQPLRPLPDVESRSRAPTSADVEEAYRVARYGHSHFDEDSGSQDEPPPREAVLRSGAVSQHIQLKVKDQQGSEVQFKIKRSTLGRFSRHHDAWRLHTHTEYGRRFRGG